MIIVSEEHRIKAANRSYLRVEKKPVRRVYIPKRNSNKKRPLGIPTIHERIQQKIYQLIMEPLYSVWGNRNSFGFRPGRCNTHKQRILIDGDIKGCFDNISHEALKELIEPYTTSIMRGQLWNSLKAGAIEKGIKLNTDAGTPQGGIISPLLANIALDVLDREMEKLVNTRHKSDKTPLSGYSRYADDFVAIIERKEHVQLVLDRIEHALSKLNLQLNMDKIKIVSIEEGLEFLGYHIRRYSNGKTHVGIPKRNAKDLRHKIKDTFKKMRAAKQDELIKALNPVINGWANYYRWTRAGYAYSVLDCWLWYKTWRWAIRRHPRKSRKWVARRYYHHVGQRKWVFAVKGKQEKLVVLNTFSRRYSEKYLKLNRDKNYFTDTDYFDLLKRRRSWAFR